MTKTFSTKESHEIAEKLKVKFNKRGLEQFRRGLKVELEHGTDATKKGVNANETDNKPLDTGRIALAHINEFPDYYTGLAKMEAKEEKKKSLKSIIKKRIK
jgi:hypothetical protein